MFAEKRRRFLPILLFMKRDFWRFDEFKQNVFDLASLFAKRRYDVRESGLRIVQEKFATCDLF